MFISVKGNGDGNGNAYSSLFYLKKLPLQKKMETYTMNYWGEVPHPSPHLNIKKADSAFFRYRFKFLASRQIRTIRINIIFELNGTEVFL